MTPELAPRRGDELPPPVPARTAAATAAAALLGALVFWSPLLFSGPLHGGDWSSHHFHYFDWVRISLTEHGTLPLYMADAWVTPNFAANAEAPAFSPFAWLLVALPTGAALKLLLVVFTAAGLGGAFLLLREHGAAPPVAAFGAVVFAWSGFFVSHVAVGHPWAMGAWLLPGLHLLYRRAALGSGGALVAGGALDAAAILSGQHQPFVWQNLWLGGFALLWAARVRALFPLSRLLLLWLVAAGLGAVKLVPLALEFADYAPTARIQGLPIGSLVASLALPGQGPGSVDPAVAFAHGAGWWEYAFYVGPLAAALLAAGVVAARGAWPALALSGFFALLSVEGARLWPLLDGLPVWRSQRAPSRFLLIALFGAVLAAAPGLERLRARAAAARPRAALVLAWLVPLIVGADLFRESLPWQRAATGPAIERRDHRPRPLAVEAGGVRAELVGFAPNRLRYRLEATSPGLVTLPLRYGHDGAEWDAGRFEPLERDGRLALEVPAGEHEVVLRYRPPGLRAGLSLSLLTLATIAGLGLARRPAVRRP